MKNWQIDKRGLTGGFRDLSLDQLPDRKTVLDKLYDSPQGGYAIFLYGGWNDHDGIVLYHFMLLKDANSTQVLFKSDHTSMFCWQSSSYPVCWSLDDKYVCVDLSIGLKGKRGGEMVKLIVNVYDQEFTIVQIAGAIGYRVDFIVSNTLKVEHTSDLRNADYYDVIPVATIEMSQLKWFSLKEFHKAEQYFNDGYFGHIMGYKNRELNKHLKKGYVAWPYNKVF